MKAHRLFFLGLLLITSVAATAQYDSSYYVSYEDQITSRFYFSKKYTSLKFRDAREKYNLTYRPNTTLNMGVGATYRSATLNLAYGFGFLNPDRGRGKTKYLDLQFHTYGRRFIVDMFGQFYKGFFLTQNSTNIQQTEYYLRPDLGVNQIGASVQYVLNHKKFSYRASFLQNEWQKKSAGTFIFGLEIYHGRVNADSTIVPTQVNSEEATREIKKMRFFEFGPNAGYAYTWVIKNHFFLTGSASISLDYGVNRTTDKNGNNEASGVSPNTFLRFFGGYNSNKWAISLTYVTNGVSIATGDLEQQIILNTGNIRLNYIYRFAPSKKAKRYLDVVSQVPPGSFL
jgi:hypothetical protein